MGNSHHIPTITPVIVKVSLIKRLSSSMTAAPLAPLRFPGPAPATVAKVRTCVPSGLELKNPRKRKQQKKLKEPII